MNGNEQEWMEMNRNEWEWMETKVEIYWKWEWMVNSCFQRLHPAYQGSSYPLLRLPGCFLSCECQTQSQIKKANTRAPNILMLGCIQQWYIFTQHFALHPKLKTNTSHIRICEILSKLWQFLGLQILSPRPVKLPWARNAAWCGSAQFHAARSWCQWCRAWEKSDSTGGDRRWAGWSLEVYCKLTLNSTANWNRLNFAHCEALPHGLWHFYFGTQPIWGSLFKDRSILGIITIVKTENKMIWVCLKIVSR